MNKDYEYENLIKRYEDLNNNNMINDKNTEFFNKKSEILNKELDNLINRTASSETLDIKLKQGLYNILKKRLNDLKDLNPFEFDNYLDKNNDRIEKFRNLENIIFNNYIDVEQESNKAWSEHNSVKSPPIYKSEINSEHNSVKSEINSEHSKSESEEDWKNKTNTPISPEFLKLAMEEIFTEINNSNKEEINHEKKYEDWISVPENQQWLVSKIKESENSTKNFLIDLQKEGDDEILKFTKETYLNQLKVPTKIISPIEDIDSTDSSRDHYFKDDIKQKAKGLWESVKSITKSNPETPEINKLGLRNLSIFNTDEDNILDTNIIDKSKEDDILDTDIKGKSKEDDITVKEDIKGKSKEIYKEFFEKDGDKFEKFLEYNDKVMKEIIEQGKKFNPKDLPALDKLIEEGNNVEKLTDLTSYNRKAMKEAIREAKSIYPNHLINKIKIYPNFEKDNLLKKQKFLKKRNKQQKM